MADFRVLLLFGLMASPAWAQPSRYMVFLKDKAGTPHSVSQPSTFLSERALLRRSKAGVMVNADDLPVTPSYVSQIRTAGAAAFFTSRWMNGVLVEATPATISTIGALPFVASTEFVAPNHRLLGGRKGKWSRAGGAGKSTDMQINMLALDTMHQDGYTGEGVLIAVLDSGFPGVDTSIPFQGIRDGNQIKLTIDFITNSTNVYQFDDHGTNVLSTMAAQTSTFQGGVPEADYLLFVTEDVPTENRVEEYNWLFAAEQADSEGADIIQSSLGYNMFDDTGMDYTISELNGMTAVVSRAATFARKRGIIVVVSAGNEGAAPWQFITPPADADGILAVGALNFPGSKASFSSVGPTSDGRTKPDVMALGIGVSVIDATGQATTSNGTSLASPLVASLMAGLVQGNPDADPADIIDAVKVTADNGSSPDNSYGYGLPSYKAARNYLRASKPVDEVTIYPNPLSSTLFITVKELPEYPVVLAIYTAQGQLVESASVDISWQNNPLQVPVSNLVSGVYLLTLRTTTFSKTFRFVKL